MRAVEFDGVEHQVAALAQQNARALPSLRVVLCSSMGTTDPKPAPFKGGSVLFWKLNAEAFLMGSGLGAASNRDNPRSDEIARDHPRSTEITNPRSPEISRD